MTFFLLGRSTASSQGPSKTVKHLSFCFNTAKCTRFSPEMLSDIDSDGHRAQKKVSSTSVETRLRKIPGNK